MIKYSILRTIFRRIGSKRTGNRTKKCLKNIFIRDNVKKDT